MGMVVTLKNGETYELPETGLSDAVAFERNFKVSSSILGTVDDPSGALYTEATAPEPALVGTPVQVPHPDQRLEHMLFMVFRGLVRLGVIPRGRQMDDEFLESVDSLGVGGDEAAPAGEESDPTGAPAARRGRSRS